MSKNNDESNLVLSDLMDHNDFSHEYKKPNKAFTFLYWVLAVALATIAISALTVPGGFAVAAGVNASIDYWDSLESELSEDDKPLPQRTILLDRNGKEFAQFFSENRQNVPLEQVNPILIDALLATEDARFYENNGFDSVALARSFVSTTSGGQKQGASGITQQLVKNLQILNAETEEDLIKAQSRTVPTKLQELKYAIALEEEYTKEELLEMYVNTVYFGNRSYGVGAAANTYFSTTPDKLTLQQAATLVGVINNPTLYDPFTSAEYSDDRKNTVLYRLLVTDKITQAEFDEATATPTPLKQGTTKNGCGESAYPYYCDLVKQEILTNPAFGDTPEVRESVLERGGLTITTAMDPKAMDIARDEALRAYGDDNRVGTGIATVQPGTGQIVAVGQNRTWGNGEGQTELNYALANRQTGSAFKPITLAKALEQGIPATTKIESNSYYKPAGSYTAPQGGFSNFGFYDYGVVDGYEATKKSMNVWYVKLLERVGVVETAQLANRLGLSIPVEGDGAVGPATLSLTLGAWESTPIEMANVYATFASGGIKCNPVSILSAKRTYTGDEIPVSDPDCHQEITPNIAHTVTDVLQTPMKQDGTAYDVRLAGSRPVAGKTGTTNAFADAWMVGYTPQYATAVWTGDPRGGAQYPLDAFVQYGVYLAGGIYGDGAKASGPLWKGMMDRIHAGVPNTKFPAPSTSVGNAITSRAVPNVIGLGVNEAITVLQEYGYVPVISQETTGDGNILRKNTVVTQTPAGGTTGSHKQEVTITLSPGSDVGMIISEVKE